MLYIKAFHIIFMVTWFAGLFYLPRLFVYHAMSLDQLDGDQISIDRFKIMERKLFFGIMTPGAILTIAMGIWMITKMGMGSYGTWLHIKLALVAILLIYHIYCGKLMIDFKYDRNKHSHVFYRWLNEFPVLLIIPIVILAVVRPF